MFEDAARELDPYPSTKARVEAVAVRAKAEGWDRQRCELELLRARRPQASEVNTMPASAPSDLVGKISEAALLLAHGVPSKTVAGWYGEQVTDRATAPQARNVTLHGLMRQTMLTAGLTPPMGGFTDASIKAALQADAQLNIQAGGTWGPSTRGASFSAVLGNVMNKLLLESWNGAGATWKQFCRLGEDLKDFKQASRFRVTAKGTLAKVPPGG